jgi:hypothetical protein
MNLQERQGVKMASIKFGAGIVGMAGKIAGTVFSRNRSGAYARGWAKPVNAKTERQMAVRALASVLGAFWAALTEAQRQAWNLYASGVTMVNRLGESMNLSGFNQYYRSNAARINAGLDVVDEGPVVMALSEQDPDLAITALAAANAVSVAFDNTAAWANEDDGAMLLYGGTPVNGNVQFFNGPWRYMGKIDGATATPPTSPAAMTSPFELGIGQKLFVQARTARADGRLSSMFRTSDIVG